MIYYKWLNKLQVYRWKKRYRIAKHLKHIEHLYQDINGYGISKAAREHQPALEYTYGEVNLESFLALLSLVHPTSNDVFYDLGSGLGKTVIACSLVYELKKCCGIEYIAELYQTACQLSQDLSTPTQQIEYQQQHILQANWDDASIIFINIASFLPEVWQDINKKINQYQTPTIISCAKPLQLSTAYLHKPTQVATSWGIIPAHIYQLKNKIDKKI